MNTQQEELENEPKGDIFHETGIYVISEKSMIARRAYGHTDLNVTRREGTWVFITANNDLSFDIPYKKGLPNGIANVYNKEKEVIQKILYIV